MGFPSWENSAKMFNCNKGAFQDLNEVIHSKTLAQLAIYLFIYLGLRGDYQKVRGVHLVSAKVCLCKPGH